MKGLGVSNAQKEHLLKLSSELQEYEGDPSYLRQDPTEASGVDLVGGPPSVDYMKRSLTHEHTDVQLWLNVQYRVFQCHSQALDETQLTTPVVYLWGG